MQKTRGKRSSNSRNKTYRLKYKPQLATVYEGSNESNSNKSEDYIFAKRSERPTFVKNLALQKQKKIRANLERNLF